jgi:hypothetical protein
VGFSEFHTFVHSVSSSVMAVTARASSAAGRCGGSSAGTPSASPPDPQDYTRLCSQTDQRQGASQTFQPGVRIGLSIWSNYDIHHM